MSAPRPLGHADGVFRAIHDARLGIGIDFRALSPSRIAPPLLARAREVWAHRVHTELRSAHIMTRFLGEVLAAGDPLEVYAGAADAILDEIRHSAMCVSVLEALGGAATLPPDEPENPAFLELGPAERALGTAVSMLAVSETLSVALLEDLRARATHVVIRAVLDATLADEDQHREFGWTYVKASLDRFDDRGREFAQATVEVTLEPHVGQIAPVFARMPLGRRTLDAWPEPELAALGLLSLEREALVLARAIDGPLTERLASVGLSRPGLAPGPSPSPQLSRR